MRVLFKPGFIKDLEKLPLAIRREIKIICAELFPIIDNLGDFKRHRIKAISGFRNYYRLRLGNYRVGFKTENGAVIFMRARHRKDIYRHFP